MSDPIGMERALALLDGADAALAATLERMDDGDLQANSLCQGWTRGHVLAHLARNADALGRLVGWAVTGQEVAGYASVEARNRDIEDGARQDLAALRQDTARSAAAFRRRAEELQDQSGLTEVRTGSASPLMAGDQIPWARLREVTYHHVDLDAGFGFADAEPEIVNRGLDEAAARVGTKADCPALTLTSTHASRWHLAGGGQEVHGTPAALLLWLARGSPSGISSDRAVPTLPSWG
ncbi:MAG: maleylpyruvate isomerase family mycothiol-dependent enzyme [Actinomycetota bacterium]|nr:maleylpyruvate isomerase family mycothiol-dependent enzyme [Actinomycetota bacterium]